jgi:hypothetical protein
MIWDGRRSTARPVHHLIPPVKTGAQEPAPHKELEMPPETIGPTSYTLSLTAQERGVLLDLLRRELGEARVEVHRTHTPDYRDRVLQNERLLRVLIDKVNGTDS